jgi:hypothetical protein
MRQDRIQFICEKILEQSTKAEIKTYLEEKFFKYDSYAFNPSTFEKDLTDIRRGNFNYSNSVKKDKKQKNIFFIKLDRSNGKYYFAEKSPIPEFNFSDNREEMTLPFLLGILNQYNSIPIVKNFIEDIKKKYFINDNEKKGIKAVVHTKPKLINEEKIINLAIKILGHIKRNECIEFNYTTVHTLDETIKNSKLHKVIPIQIRLYENLYYLIGFNIELKKISNFRLDQFFKFQVEALEDEETDNKIYFEDEDIAKLDIENYFNNTIGVWCHSSNEKVEKVEITFRDWAASLIRSMPIHHTQTPISADFENNKLTIQIEIKLLPYSESRKTARERSYELAFLLGRFREFCEVNEEKLINNSNK